LEFFADPRIWIALFTLTALEIVLGIDNIIFIAILAGRLPKGQQGKGRIIGLGLAMVTRIALLFSLTFIMRLTEPIFTILGQGISGRDIILITGGLFLLGKSTHEVHGALEGSAQAYDRRGHRENTSFMSVIIQIMLLDIVFSLDSVITAIGLTDQLIIMVAAIVIAVIFMMVLSSTVSTFIENHPTIKILALSFLLMIGVALIGEGLDLHIPKGYIYFSMAFSLFVELLNTQLRKSTVVPLQLHRPHGDAKKNR